MLTNYFKIAWRNLWLNKTLGIIKIFGLSIGLAVCILIFLFTKDELSYDQFHENKDRLYRVVQTWKLNDEDPKYIGTTNSIVSETFSKEIPEIQQVTRVNGAGIVIKKNNDVFTEYPLFVDENFLSVFSFPLKAGSRTSALKDPHAVVISENMAVKYFGLTDVIGQTLSVKINEEFENYTISAIIENSPGNSTLKTDILLPFQQYEKYNSNQDWIGGSLNTMVLISPQANIPAVEQKMQALFNRFTNEELAKIKQSKGMDVRIRLSLQPYTDIHLSENLGPDNGMTDGSKPVFSYILSFIALFILVIACINFINLSIAQSLRRSKEIGVRKVIGSSRGQLIFQFLAESFLVSLIAFGVASSLVALSLPFFNILSGKQLSLNYLADGWFYAGLVVLLLVTAFVAGFYPSLVLSAFRPVKALYSREKMNPKNYLTRGLVVLQFSLAICLILGTIAFQRQMRFLSKADLGYDSSNLLRLSIPVRKSSDPLPALFKSALASNPGVKGITARNGGRSIAGVVVDGKNIEIEKTKVDDDYLPTFKIPLIAGRNFSPDFSADTASSVIVNESFLKAAGLSVSAAVGKTIRMNRNNKDVNIIGVVKDFHFVSLKEKIMPLVLVTDPEFNYGEIWLRLDPEHIPETMAGLQSTFRELVPLFPYSYRFMDDINAERYNTEQKWQFIITLASAFFIIISCMGLLGLVMLSIEYRVKEIGIRKVLGAATAKIIILISREFFLLIIIAFFIAAPVGYYFIGKWLQNFAYRAEIHWWIFGLAGLAVLFIAAATISFQSIRAARANPVESLRTE